MPKAKAIVPSPEYFELSACAVGVFASSNRAAYLVIFSVWPKAGRKMEIGMASLSA